MKLEIDFEKLLFSDEGKTLEFKENVLNMKSILKTMIAFSNTAGGCLIVGVRDKDKKIIGVQDPLLVEEQVINTLDDSISPKIAPNIETIRFRNKSLIFIEVFPGPQKPYYFKTKTPETSSYYRIGSTNRLADIPLIEEMKRSVNHQSYDETPLINANPEAVSFRLASGFFKKIRTLVPDDLETLLLVSRVGNQKFPTVGGILLFAADRSTYFPDYRVQMGVFKGLTKTIIIDSKETTESPVDAIETIEQFFKKHLSQMFVIEKIQREEKWEIPLVVLREAVLNAFLHADYSQTGSSIRVCIFDDRVEIENPGILPFGLTLEDLKRGISKIRNRVISRVFKELKIVETWGSGIRRMIDTCENHNLPEPVFEEIGSHFRVTIFRHQKELYFFDETNQKIMDLIKEHSKLSNKEIAGFLGISQRALRARLQRLVEEGHLKAMGVGPYDPNKKYTL